MNYRKVYSRKFMRQYYANNCYISIDGNYVERDYKDSSTGEIKTYNPTIYQDCKTYERYVLVKKVRTNIAEMVLTCYGPPKPKHGVSYIIHHKDGVMSNDNLSNLEWIEDTPSNRALIETQIQQYCLIQRQEMYKGLKIKAKKSGEITQKGENLSYHYNFFDEDIDWQVYIYHVKVKYTFKNQWGNYSRDRFEVEDVLDDFGLISGNKALLTKPVVLHLDNDFLNFESSNLVWCEADDPRYIDYKKERLRKCMELEIDSNIYKIKKGIVAPGFKERYADVLDLASIAIP